MSAGRAVQAEELAGAGLLLFQPGFHRGLPAPVVHERELPGVRRPDNGPRLYDHHGGLLTWPVFGVIVLSILVGSILGALLGMKLMRKHFVKAGLAQ